MPAVHQAALDGHAARQSETTGYLAMGDLRARGWTPGMVSRLLGAPDSTKPNPVFRSASPVRLWAEWRVLDAEAHPSWDSHKRRAQTRSRSAQAAAATRRRNLVAWASKLEVRLDPIPDPVGAAIAAYNERNTYDTDVAPAALDSSPVFLDRITVNHLRHDASRYEDALESAYGRTGVDEARQIIRRRVYAAIATAYPELRDECNRQLDARGLPPLNPKEPHQ